MEVGPLLPYLSRRSLNHKNLDNQFYVMCFFIQARDVQTNDVVAIKKMSYSGKQSSEV